MSYSQSYNSESGNGNSGGGGCMLLLLAAAAFALVMSMGGDDTHTHTTTDTRSGLLSGNQTELLSRNQMNILSDVWNCFGDNSCIITTELITNVTTSNEVMNLDGDRNIVYAANGAMMCPNPDNPNEWGDRADWCAAAGVTP